MKILAIDQSTTSTTGFLFDETGQGRVLVTRTHRQIYPQAGWVEHDPLELLANVTACLEAGRAAGVMAVGLSNQGESCLAWDAASGEPVSPVLVWQDARTTDFCTNLDAEHGAEIAARARLPVDPYFSASKFRWILDHLPDAASLARAGRLRLGTTDAFLRDRLGGRFQTDLATASRTSLLDFQTCDWDPRLCALFGVPMETLPEITDCNGPLGDLLGLPLTGAIVDQQAALLGHGVTTSGDVKTTFGTGAFALAVTGETPPAYGTGALPTVAWREAGQPAVYALEGGVHAASAAVNWTRELGLFEDLAALADFDGHALARGLAFVPALAGLACPHWDQTAKGAWLGLGLGTTSRDMMQAVLEGIAYRTREVLEAMAAEVPLAQTLRVDGGMTANEWFCQCLADVTGRTVEVALDADLTAFGVARLAARGLGQDLPAPPPGLCLSPRPEFIPLPDRFADARRLVQDWG